MPAPDDLMRFAEWEWLSLAERRETYPRLTGPPASADPEAVARRVAYWRSAAKLESDARFARRLALDGLDEATFAGLIWSEPEPPRAAHPAAAACVEPLLDALEIAADRGEEAMRQVAAIDATLRSRCGGLRPLAPFATLAVERLRRLGPEPGVMAALVADLVERLDQILSPALILKLNLERLAGTLTGETPEERFMLFMRRPALLGELVTEFPLLGRLLVETAGHTVAGAERLLRELEADGPLLEAAGLLSPARGAPTGLELGLSDPHDGQRGVAIVSYASGERIVAKPKPLGVDAAFQELLDFVDERGLSVPLRPLALLDLGDRGYVEYVDTTACTGADEVERFFHRQGSYLALLYALQAIDFHGENLIAAGEHPVLVDLECLLHPHPPAIADQSALHAELMASMSASVLNSGLLPMFVVEDDRFTEVGGLGRRAGQVFVRPGPALEDPATDRMRVVQRPIEMPVSQNLPVHDGEQAEPTAHVADLIDGFRETYRLLVAYRDELLGPDGMLRRFADVPVRQIVRPTWHYSALIRDALHPDFLRSGADRDLVFDRLWGSDEAFPAMSAFIAGERAAMWAGDVPLFRFAAGATESWDTTGRRYPSVFPEPPLQTVERALAAWDERDMERQVDIIAGSMAAMAITLAPESLHGAAGHLVRGGEPPAPDARRPSADELISSAVILAERIADQALRSEDGALWLGLSPVDATRWRFGPLGFDVYGGTAGIALFLAHCGALAGRDDLTDLARAAVELAGRAGFDDEPQAGAFSGWPSRLWALARTGAVLGEPAIGAAAAERAAEQAHTQKPTPLDLLGGSAGAALVLLRLARIAGRSELRELAHAAGDRLAETLPVGPGGRLAPDTQLLAGVSHGAAGMAWAAAELAADRERPELRALVDALHAYEAGLYAPERENWLDLRGAEDGAPPGDLFAWCHGAPGLALARLGVLRALGDVAGAAADAERAVEATRRRGWQPNQSLCHGSLGNADTLLVAAERLGRAALFDDALRWGARALDERRATGRWRCGTPPDVEVPGLMTGLAGIGLQLMRLADPRSVPSVLALDD